MKKIHIIGVLTVLMLIAVVFPAGADPRYDLEVELNKVVIDFSEPKPYIDTFSDRSFVPLREVAEKIGAEVEWDQTGNAAVVKYKGQDIRMEIGAKVICVDGIKKMLNSRAEIISGCTMVSADFFAKAWKDIDMYWDYGTRRLILFDVLQAREGMINQLQGTGMKLQINTLSE